jgi:hypothetical protein
VIEGAEVLPNDRGTAPGSGWRIRRRGRCPVRPELKAMFDASVCRFRARIVPPNDSHPVHCAWDEGGAIWTN